MGIGGLVGIGAQLHREGFAQFHVASEHKPGQAGAPNSTKVVAGRGMFSEMG